MTRGPHGYFCRDCEAVVSFRSALPDGKQPLCHTCHQADTRRHRVEVASAIQHILSTQPPSKENP